MSRRPSKSSGSRLFPLIPVFFILIFLLQYWFRSLDDNRVTSWESAFRFAGVGDVLFMLGIGLLAAWPLSRVISITRYRPFLLFLCSCAAVLPFLNESEMILDASRYFTQAKHLELSGAGYFLREWGRGIFAWTDLPVVPFIYGTIFRIFGENILWIRVFTTFCFALTVVLTYLTGRKIWDEECGYTAGILMLGIPYLYPQVPLMLVDVPLMFFFIFSVYTFILAMEKGGIMIFASALLIGITFMTKYSSWLMLSELLVVMGVYGMRLIPPKLPPLETRYAGRGIQSVPQLRQVLLRGAAVFLSAFILIALVWLMKSDVFLSQLELLREYQGPGLRRWGESFLSTFFFQVHPVITVAALFSAWAALRGRDARVLIAFWLLILVAVFQIRRTRYIMMVFPFLCLAAGYGLMQIRRAETRRFIVAGVVASSIVVAVFAYLPFLNALSSVNLGDAGRFLNSAEGNDIEVFTVYGEAPAADPAVVIPLLDLYTDKRISYNDPGTFGGNPRDVLTSSLRFTWEYQNPHYYREGVNRGGRKAAVVVITDQREFKLPEGLEKTVGRYGRLRVFDKDEEEYEFKTLVRVYYD